MARSILVYGPTKSRKTSAAASFAHYIAKVTGKATILFSADGGGWDPAAPEVEVGMMVPYAMDKDRIPPSILRKFSQGYFPENPKETDVEKLNMIPIDWDKFGGAVVEGWTSISDVLMRFYPDKNVNLGGETRAKLGQFKLPVIVNGQPVIETFSSNTRGDYGEVQKQISGIVSNINAFPCHMVMYTALEKKGEDEDRSTVYGPSIPGKATVAQSPQWVGDCIHAQDYVVPRVVKVPDPTDPTGKQTLDSTILDRTVRFYYVSHPDPVTGIPFPAGTRVPPAKIAELYKRFPGGYFEPGTEPGTGLDMYLEFCDSLTASAVNSDALRGWRERADAKRKEIQARTSAAVGAAKK